jgi:hypothetical protein
VWPQKPRAIPPHSRRGAFLVLELITSCVWSIHGSPCGRHFAVGYASSDRVVVWDAISGQVTRACRHRDLSAIPIPGADIAALSRGQSACTSDLLFLRCHRSLEFSTLFCPSRGPVLLRAASASYVGRPQETSSQWRYCMRAWCASTRPSRGDTTPTARRAPCTTHASGSSRPLPAQAMPLPAAPPGRAAHPPHRCPSISPNGRYLVAASNTRAAGTIWCGPPQAFPSAAPLPPFSAAACAKPVCFATDRLT